VSALQWLFYSDKRDHRAKTRLTRFFTALYRCLRRGARAALQIYPESSEQLEVVTAVAVSCGFTGGLVTDFPNSTKAKKHYLCLFAGRAGADGVTDAAVATPAPRLTAGGRGEDDDDEEHDDEGDDDGMSDGEGGGGGVDDERMTSGGASRGARSMASAFSRRTRAPADEAELVAGGRGTPAGGAGAPLGGAWDAARDAIAFETRRKHAKRAGKGKASRSGPAPKSKEWIEAKRQARIAKGLQTRHSSKYTGRRRSGTGF
jgi:hypothetical protein